MAYKKADMIKQCVKAIEENSLMFIDEIIAFVPFSRATFYNHDLDKLDIIKDATDHNKIKEKVRQKNHWKDSDNATLRVAFYKLIGTDEEYKRLANARHEVDQTTKNHHTVEYKNVSKDPNFKDK